MRLTKFALDNPRVVLLLVVFIFVAGIITYSHFPAREDPHFLLRKGVVTTYLPGANALTVERLVTKPLEEELRNLKEVKEVESLSRGGVSMITVRLKSEYFELSPIWQKIRSRLKDSVTKLPRGLDGPYLNDDFSDVSIANIALSGKSYSYRDLEKEAKRVRQSLYQIKSLKKITLLGVQNKEFYLEVSNAKLARYGLTPQLLISEIAQQNLLLASGQINLKGNNVLIETTGNIKNLEQLESIVIKVPKTNELVYLSDLFHVKHGYAESPKEQFFFNGKPAVILSLTMQHKANIIEVGEAIKQWYQHANRQLPVGMHMQFATFQPHLVAKSKHDFTVNLFQTLACVMLVVILALGFKEGALAGLIVPLTILSGVLIMRLLGIELHRVSIGSMIISLGLLVDNAIVVTEDIMRRYRLCDDIEQAILASASQMTIPLLISSLTTILAFAPIFFADDTTAEFVHSLPQVISIFIILSWFLSLTVIPMAIRLFTHKSSPLPRTQKLNSRMSLTGVFGFVLDYSPLIVVTTLALITLALLTTRYVSKQIFPLTNRKEVLVNLEYPNGTHFTRTKSLTLGVQKWLDSGPLKPEVANTLASIGSSGARFYISQRLVTPASNVAQILVNLNKQESAPGLMQRLSTYLANHLSSGRVRLYRLWFGPTEPNVLVIRLLNENLSTLAKLSNELQVALHKIPATFDIRDDLGNRVLKIIVDINQAKAKLAGVSTESVAQTLNAFSHGGVITKLVRGDLMIPLKLRGERSERQQLARMRDLEVYSLKDNKSVPLGQVASFHTRYAFAQIRHYELQRGVEIKAKNLDIGAKGLYTQIKPLLTSLTKKEHVRYTIEGALKKTSTSTAALFQYMPICFLFMVALLLWEFNSFRYVLLIFLSIPCMLIGVMPTLWLFHANLGFMAMLGILSLSGIMINNVIILLDSIKINLSHGLMQREAILQACQTRLRPVLMTMATTVIGLVPLLLSGSALWYDLTLVIISGLLVGTLVTLFFIPACYQLLFRTYSH